MSSFPSGQPQIESKRILCGVLAIVLGGLGVHRFILGDVVGGILRIVISVATCGFGGIISLIEGVIYLTKSDADFIQIYQIGGRKWF
jgi:TM2 domain-containing membrane protein YozV